MIDDIITKQNYLTSTRYISGRIVEYDLKSANISVLKNRDIITNEDYEKLKNLPKDIREKEIGLREKADPSIYTEIQLGIREAKLLLSEQNNLDEEQIVRIANDALYINSPLDLKFTKFGEYIEFKHKSEYDIYCNLNGIIIFCKFSDDNIHIDVKGLGDNSNLHQDYMVYTIMYTIALLERSSVVDAIQYLNEICEQYIHRQLPIGYYREFNSQSLYRIIYNIVGGTFEKPYITNVAMNCLSDVDISVVDINYNYTVLRELWSILFEIYTIRRR